MSDKAEIKRKGLPKLVDFKGAKLFKPLPFWSIYDRDAVYAGGIDIAKNINRNLKNRQSVSSGSEISDIVSDGHGIYIISDSRITDKSQLSANRKTVPVSEVIYVGQAGADSTKDKSSFHERIYKHALVAVGIHNGSWGDEPIVHNSGMDDSEYWKDYRERRVSNWNNVTLPVDDWWISLITLPSMSFSEKLAIKRLEDLLMLGASALCRADHEKHDYVFSKTLPFCNKQFSLGLLNDVYKHPWKPTTGEKKPKRK